MVNKMKKNLKKITTNAMVKTMKPLAKAVDFLGDVSFNLGEKAYKAESNFDEMLDSLNKCIKTKELMLAKLNEESSTKTKKKSSLLGRAVKGLGLLIDELEKIENSLKEKLQEEDSLEETEDVGFFKKAIQTVTKLKDNSIKSITDFAENTSKNVTAFKNSISLKFTELKKSRIEKKYNKLSDKLNMYKEKKEEVENKITELESSDLLVKKSDKSTKTKKKSFFTTIKPFSFKRLDVA